MHVPHLGAAFVICGSRDLPEAALSDLARFGQLDRRQDEGEGRDHFMVEVARFSFLVVR
jgi:hypothetical protein